MIKPTLIEQIGILHADEADGIDLTDPFRPTGPYGIAKACEAKIAELEAERSALPKSQRKAITAQLQSLRTTMRWCRSRAGYEEPQE